MSHPRSLFVVVGVLVATLTLLGCGGGGAGGSADDGDARQTSTTSEPTTTTATPATIDLSRPIPGGSLHGTPRPPLENTGDDYVAIIESLIANFRWLTENPDVATLDELYVPGTDTHAFQASFFTELTTNGWRSSDERYHVLSVDLVDVAEGLVSVRFSDAFEFERIVDSTGTQVGEGREREPNVKTWNALLTRDEQGRWRFAEVIPVQEGTVEL